MFDANQMLAMGLQYISSNPAGALRTLFTAPPVRAYVLGALDEAQQEFLSHQVMRDPAGLLRFMLSAEGQRATAGLVEAYRQQHLAAARQPTSVTIRRQQP